jgi:hypothetical protein
MCVKIRYTTDEIPGTGVYVLMKKIYASAFIIKKERYISAR